MQIYLVGGAVRDKLLGRVVKEKDYVVVGATPAEMIKLGYKQVGKDFPVFLHPKTAEEYALARKERKVAPGYTGFEFDSSPEVTLEEDLLRRDLTVNAMAESGEGQIIDPYEGQKDLAKKLLRHVSEAFSEDPVRILRVARFASRFAEQGFKVAPETNRLMQEMVEKGEVDALVAERVWKELERALGESSPTVFFEVLAACHALAPLFPMVNCQGQEMKALRLAAEKSEDTIVRFAVFTHAYSPEQILWLAKHYRIPSDYQDLAKVVAEWHEKIFTTLDAEATLTLFEKIDAFRREERFTKFIQCAEILASLYSKTFDARGLRDSYQLVKKIDTQPFITEGLTGKAIGDRVREERLTRLRKSRG